MKGACRHNNPFRGTTIVSDKGQIVIPSDLRKELKIKRGDQLIIIKRKDGRGFSCLPAQSVNKIFNDLAKE